MSSTSADQPTSCGAEHPNQANVSCDRSPHPYGPHLHRSSGVTWPGREQPTRPAGMARGERARQVATKVIESGAQRRTGAPDPQAAIQAALNSKLRP